MQRTLLRDERGGILATLHIQDNGDVIIYDKNLHYKGRYIAKNDFTLDENGRYVGRGNLTGSLISDRIDLKKRVFGRKSIAYIQTAV